MGKIRISYAGIYAIISFSHIYKLNPILNAKRQSKE